MSVFSAVDFDSHEQVLFCHDPAVGLFGIIAIHSTSLGPAAGGCRMYPYESVELALTDVLRLSKGMSYKNAMAGLPLGGGKSVIIADSSNPHKADLLRAFSRHVQSLGGRYWTAIDVGVGPKDADILAENCDYIFARASQYPVGFNASHFTALGGFMGIKAVAKHLWDKSDLSGLRVAIQGLGGTGRELSRHLYEAGAKLIVADINEEAVNFVVENYQALAVSPMDIHKQEVDIFAPCALGGIVNDDTLPEIKAKAICGLANNQLKTPRHGQLLLERGITYVPDYVVNAGGMMGAGTMIYSQPGMEESMNTVRGLYDIILNLLEKAKAANRPSSEMADEMALKIIHSGNPILMDTL
ncbi:MAG: Glu/Leu/Phe/Val dehydrogenase dimerization domain-containing protein [Bacteroidota bacterium]